VSPSAHEWSRVVTSGREYFDPERTCVESPREGNHTGGCTLLLDHQNCCPRVRRHIDGLVVCGAKGWWSVFPPAQGGRICAAECTARRAHPSQALCV